MLLFITLSILSLFFYPAYCDDDNMIIDFQTGYVDGVPLPGDLSDLNFTTPVGLLIAQILELNISAQSSSSNIISLEGTSNPCYKWAKISLELSNLFVNFTTGECTSSAGAAIRAGFHDAGTWSASLAASGQGFGGADGSIYLFNETSRPANSGLETIVQILGELAEAKGVGVGDMIQFAAAHATVSCPGGPRIRTFIGRNDATQSSVDGLLPSVFSDAETLLDLFFDKNIGPLDLVALVGAHSVSRQKTVNVSRVGDLQDSASGIWDTKFYEETISSGWVDRPGVLTFPSDKALSSYGPLQAEWNGYVARPEDWVEHFARAYLRLSLAGVKQI